MRINGSNFKTGVSVSFGGVPSSTVVVVDQATLQAVTPSHTVGLVDVIAINTDGLSATLPSAYSYAPCAYLLSPAGQSFPAPGGTNSITLTTSVGCPWSATSSAPWITIGASGSGTGSATVIYVVGENLTFTQRVGTISVAGQTFTVYQDGRPPIPIILVHGWCDSPNSFGLMGPLLAEVVITSTARLSRSRTPRCSIRCVSTASQCAAVRRRLCRCATDTDARTTETGRACCSDGRWDRSSVAKERR